jgi:hypothetical protein
VSESRFKSIDITVSYKTGLPRIYQIPELKLATLTDGRYRIGLEECWHHELPTIRNPDRIWYEQIPCQGGAFIGLYSLSPFTLQLSTPRVKNAKKVWEAIRDVAGARADFHFDGEAAIYFPLEAVHVVATLAGARKKRRLSEAHKAKLAEANQAYRFKPKLDASETPKTAQN